MFGRSTKLAAILVVSVTAFFLGGIAGAETAETPQANETQVTKQGPAFEGGERKSTEAGSRVEEAQTRFGAPASRARDLDQQTQKLGRELEARREAAAASQGRDDGTRSREALGGLTARMLDKGHESVEFHRDSRRALKGTLRQLTQKRKEHRKVREEQRAPAEELRRREGELEGLVGGFGSKKERMEVRIAQLEAADRAGLFDRPPASGDGGATTREQELEIAREDIVARPVEPIPYERYVQIYKASAKRYGFAKDWYVLATVGNVESNHGENMGPSSAGAMGPMQFLPSTWKEYGVDGDGDGDANIMNPADAIPAAARYLRDGGAPNDWHKALYTYNHSGPYVREVLGAAEGYRRLAKDDEVKPYV